MSCRDLHWGSCWHGDLKLESQQGKSSTKSVIQGHKLLVTAWGSFPRKTALKQKLLTCNHRRTPKLCVKGFICVSFNVVCVYAYMYVCIVWVHAYVYICVCNECMYACMWMNMSVCIWVCVHAYVCIHVWCICVCMALCAHIFMKLHIHVLIHMFGGQRLTGSIFLQFFFWGRLYQWIWSSWICIG